MYLNKYKTNSQNKNVLYWSLFYIAMNDTSSWHFYLVLISLLIVPNYWFSKCFKSFKIFGFNYKFINYTITILLQIWTNKMIKNKNIDYHTCGFWFIVNSASGHIS